MSDLDGFSVLLVDDHPLFREGLMLALHQREPGLVVSAVASIEEAQVHLQRLDQSTDLVLMDYRLPGGDGLKQALALRQRFSAVAFAVMSGAEDAQLPARVREANLMGFFSKSLHVSELLRGLKQLARGESYFSPGAPPIRAAVAETLTHRQREILDMVARGATNKEIAQVLQIAPHTVKNHLAQIYERLGASNRTQATAMHRV